FGKSDAASNSASAMMPLRGVRMSWASPASATSIAAGLDRRRFRLLRLAFAMRAPTPAMARILQAQPQLPPNFGWRHALCAELTEAGGLCRLGELAAFAVEHQPMMMVDRRGQ